MPSSRFCNRCTFSFRYRRIFFHLFDLGKNRIFLLLSKVRIKECQVFSQCRPKIRHITRSCVFVAIQTLDIFTCNNIRLFSQSVLYTITNLLPDVEHLHFYLDATLIKRPAGVPRFPDYDPAPRSAPREMGILYQKWPSAICTSYQHLSTRSAASVNSPKTLQGLPRPCCKAGRPCHIGRIASAAGSRRQSPNPSITLCCRLMVASAQVEMV